MLPSCACCSKAIEASPVAAKRERKGKVGADADADTLKFHSSCVRCCVCLQSYPTDGPYFLNPEDSSTSLYCSTDYKQRFLTPCSACGADFALGDARLTVDGQTLHRACFITEPKAHAVAAAPTTTTSSVSKLAAAFSKDPKLSSASLGEKTAVPSKPIAPAPSIPATELTASVRQPVAREESPSPPPPPAASAPSGSSSSLVPSSAPTGTVLLSHFSGASEDDHDADEEEEEEEATFAGASQFTTTYDDSSDEEPPPPPPPPPAAGSPPDAALEESNLAASSAVSPSAVTAAAAAAQEEDNCIISELLSAPPPALPPKRKRTAADGAKPPQPTKSAGGEQDTAETSETEVPPGPPPPLPPKKHSTASSKPSAPVPAESAPTDLASLLKNRKRLIKDQEEYNPFKPPSYEEIRRKHEATSSSSAVGPAFSAPAPSSHLSTSLGASSDIFEKRTAALNPSIPQDSLDSSVDGPPLSWTASGEIPASQLAHLISKGILVAVESAAQFGIAPLPSCAPQDVAKMDFRVDNRRKDLHNVTYRAAGQRAEFQFMDYAPSLFAHIRAHYALPPAVFLKSLTSTAGGAGSGGGIKGGAVGEGKSGMVFYFSADGRYVIKSLKREEVSFFRKSVLADYADYVVRKQKQTLLPRFLGMWKITYQRKGAKMQGNEGKESIRLICMNNIFHSPPPPSPGLPPIKFQHKFDLKGSTRNRKIPSHLITPGRVLLDVNFSESVGKLHFGAAQKLVILTQLRKDAEWLTNKNIMDHSLLVGIHVDDDHEEQNAATSASSSAAPVAAHELSMPLTYSTPGVDATSMWQKTRGGLRAWNTEGTKPRKEIYFLGIIDILQVRRKKEEQVSKNKSAFFRTLIVCPASCFLMSRNSTRRKPWRARISHSCSTKTPSRLLIPEATTKDFWLTSSP
jgi:hypothetical protein